MWLFFIIEYTIWSYRELVSIVVVSALWNSSTENGVLYGSSIICWKQWNFFYTKRCKSAANLECDWKNKVLNDETVPTISHASNHRHITA